MEYLTQEEKIDYIYKTLKKQERRFYVKSIFRTLIFLGILAYLAYFYLYGLDMIMNNIDEVIKSKLSSEMGSPELNLDKEKIIETFNSITNGTTNQ